MAIAPALVIDPIFVVADERTSMLDVSIRIGVMQLIEKLTAQRAVSYRYIIHDLAIARYMCQEIAVMHLGKIVERRETEEIFGYAFTRTPGRVSRQFPFPTHVSPGRQSRSKVGSPLQSIPLHGFVSTIDAIWQTRNVINATTLRWRTKGEHISWPVTMCRAVVGVPPTGQPPPLDAWQRALH